jgi:Amt family ammonium transporter
MMTSSVLVFLMVPGLALFYSGVSDHRSTLSMAWLPVMTSAVVGVQVRQLMEALLIVLLTR